MTSSFVDIHCHLLPGIDDGPRDWDEALATARLAVDSGTSTIVVTPHQFGSFRQNHGDHIRALATEMQQRLDSADIPLRVLPGAEVRIEPGIADGLANGELLSLGDHSRHVLIELPHELYLPLESVIDELARRKVVAVLAHPERNLGLQRRPQLLPPLVDAGCLMQITAGSVHGAFGSAAKQLSEWLLVEGLVHFVASDGHGPRSRRPLLSPAYELVAALVGPQSADDLFRHNPACVAAGTSVTPGRREVARRPRRWWARKAVA